MGFDELNYINSLSSGNFEYWSRVVLGANAISGTARKFAKFHNSFPIFFNYCLYLRGGGENKSKTSILWNSHTNQQLAI
jgi:hypothetical protein